MEKKVLLLMLFIGSSVLSNAQDIIVTTNSEKIEANIVEVSGTEVKYKSFTNPDGPLFVLSTANIASIIYRNGDVQTFTSQQQNAVISVREAKDIVLVPGQKIEKVDRKTVNDNDTKVKYYYGNVALDETMYKDFIQLNCPEAYRQYKKGHNMAWGGTVIGGAVFIGGVILVLRPSNSGTLAAGGIMLGVGAGVAIPCIVCGMKKQEKALDVFNNQCANNKETASLTISLVGNSNGLGLALNF